MTTLRGAFISVLWVVCLACVGCVGEEQVAAPVTLGISTMPSSPPTDPCADVHAPACGGPCGTSGECVASGAGGCVCSELPCAGRATCGGACGGGGTCIAGPEGACVCAVGQCNRDNYCNASCSRSSADGRNQLRGYCRPEGDWCNCYINSYGRQL